MPIAAPMTLTTAVGTDLLFKAMDATEELGRLFEFKVEAQAEIGTTIDPVTLLGKPACVALQIPGDKTRHFHGLVCAMETGGTVGRDFLYRLFLRPWLWQLTRRTDTRVFQEMTVVEILEQVFKPFQPNHVFEVTGAFPKYDYCVQYRESDFDFVSRLMEQEGIYYYFRHTAGEHKMVIVNAPNAHRAYPSFEAFEFREKVDGQIDLEPITQWHAHQEIQSGQVVLRDYDFTKPQTKIEGKTTSTLTGASATLEVYDFPGRHAYAETAEPAEISRYSKLRMEELQARYERVHGYGSIRGLVCGHRFKLLDHPPQDPGQEYVVVSTHIVMHYSGYEAGADRTDLHCHFTAIPAKVTFRSACITQRPIVSGLHTAIVVGPAGEEIHTDLHGRVKVQFHWDRHGLKNDTSSCWVRVSSPWGGKGWGGLSLPRIGQEVVVDFLGGDPDKPLITGRVYNGDQTPPYKLPDNKTVSTNKSRSSKAAGADNFNELRFQDLKGSEYVWFQAEKDFHQLVKHDATLLVQGKQDRIVNLDLTEQIDGAVKIKIGKDNVTEVLGKHSLKVNEDIMTESSASISQKSATKTDIKIGTDLGVDAGVNVHLKAGVNVVIEASTMITLKAAGGSVVIGPAGVSIVGTMVMINSGGAPGSGGGASPKPVLAVVKPVNKKDPL